MGAFTAGEFRHDLVDVLLANVGRLADAATGAGDRDDTTFETLHV